MVLRGRNASLSGVLSRVVPTVRAGAVVRFGGPANVGAVRYRRAILSGGSALAARGVSIVSVLVTVPLALSYLGADSYGLWMTITSFATLLGFADLGVGNGLINAVAEAFGRDDEDAMRRSVSSAFFLLLVLAVAGSAALALAYPFIPWASLYNVDGTAAGGAAGPASLVFGLVLLAGLPLGIAARVQAGLQEGYLTGLWAAVGALLGLAGTISAIELHAGLAVIVGVTVAGPAVASAANTLTLFGRRRRALTPGLRLVSRAWLGRLWRVGGYFFVIQVAIAAAYQSDSIVLARVRGPHSVAEYAVAMRLFTIAPLVLGLVLAPLWPAYTEALARGDIGWVRATLRRSVALGLAVNLLPTAALVVFGRQVVRIWAGGDVVPAQLLIVALGCWAVLNSLGGPLAMFLNGVGAIRWQAFSASAMAVANLGLSIWLAREVGTAGVVIGTVAAQLAFIFLPYVFYIPRLLRSLEQAAPLPAAVQ